MGPRADDRPALRFGMRDWLLVLWIATLGTDRIDLLGGQGSFILTPFLAVTPLVVFSELTRLAERRGDIVVTRNVPEFFTLLTVFLAVVLMSVFFSYDLGMSAKRYALLVAEVYGTLFVLVAVMQREDARRILVRGAYAGLLVGFLFNAVQVRLWMSLSLEPTGGFIELAPQHYGGLLPRLSGQALDMNRGGFLFLIYMFLLVRFAAPSRWRTIFLWLGAFSIVATLSRSVMLGVFAMGLVALHRAWLPKIGLRSVFTGTAIAASVLIIVLLAWDRIMPVLDVLAPLAGRLSTQEGSSSEHLLLLVRGVETGTASVKQALVGIGFGNAFTVLQDIYPGNKYGNFHSLYVTLLAESGIIALGLCLVLLARPMLISPTYRPLIAALIAFNVFYQTITGNLLWLCLALAWLEPGGAARAPRVEVGRPADSAARLPVTA
jgi:hypothetical protein